MKKQWVSGPIRWSRIFRLLTLILAFIPTWVRAETSAAGGCPGALPSRLAKGQPAQVLPGMTDDLHASPLTSSQILGRIPGGDFADVVDGPTCAEKAAWWQVTYGNLTGWMPEAAKQTYLLDQAEYAEVGGVRLAMPEALKPVSATLAQSEGGPGSGQSPFYPTYAHIVFRADQDEADYGTRLNIFPMTAYMRADPVVAEEILWLKDVLKQHRALKDGDKLPFVMAYDVAQIFTARAHYAQMGSLVGISYLTWYAQADVPIRNPLIYSFQGMTADGKYYVSLAMDVALSSLPDPNDVDSAAFSTEDAYSRYLASLMPTLSQAPATHFAPRLETLDGILASLEIASGALANKELAPSLSIRDLVHPLSYGVCQNTKFPTRLAKGVVARQVVPNKQSLDLYTWPGGDGTGDVVELGEQVTVLDGPVCQEGENYWLVYHSTHYGKDAGWVEENGIVTGKEGGAVYFFEPVIGGVPTVPETLTGQTVTACQLMPLFHPDVSDAPSSSPTQSQYRLIDGATYYADALLLRPEGGFGRWRLAPGATLLDDASSGFTHHTRVFKPLWILALDDPLPSNGCQNVPVITAP